MVKSIVLKANARLKFFKQKTIFFLTCFLKKTFFNVTLTLLVHFGIQVYQKS